ncbi:hypothetical protein [Palaeococcus ferrophilus]|uniref:hypothetical protein n=1 Tax=Palaeococcus ferrophilus TaxID=83868 RepID=UPI00064F4DD0|nr:hypothetical protein [Palaeococcus ferrophilus]
MKANRKVILLPFFLLLILLAGIAVREHVEDSPKEEPGQEKYLEEATSQPPTVQKPELPPILPEDFMGGFIGYVYGPMNTTGYVSLYWCYPKEILNASAAVSISSHSPFEGIDYRGDEISTTYRGYLRLLIPINFSKLSDSFPKDMDFQNVSASLIMDMDYYDASARIGLTTPLGSETARVNLGNWTFNVAKGLPETMPNVTAYRNEDVSFEWGIHEVGYVVGLYNPASIPMEILNISFELPDLLPREWVVVKNISAYKGNSIYDVPERAEPSDMGLKPGEVKYFVLSLEVHPQVKGLFLQPRIVYSLNGTIYAMPGPPFQYTVMEGACAHNGAG